ncbi:MAG: gliding motility protein GldM [Tannerella sp.]|nr:gliding motility protein GldM [Tannerella sp.]
MAISNNPNSPRQKMINLMYLVFIAMMALNVSVEVLDGFELVERSLKKTTSDTAHRNELLMQELEDYYRMNEAKVADWYRKGEDVKSQSDGLCNYMQELKLRIVQEADGMKGSLEDIHHKDDLEAASEVMLAPVTGEGKKLYERLVNYRDSMAALVNDTARKSVIASVLDLEVPAKGGIGIARSWEATLFEHMPVAAAITLLTKLQSDVRYVEGEVLASLLNGIDVGAYRVNRIQAMVIPQSQIVMRGTPYRAQIVLAALDSTQQPRIFVGQRELPATDNGWYTGGSGGLGLQTFSGHIELSRADGTTGLYPFSETYSVTEPTATIAPTLMNVLYESIENDIEVAIPGVPSNNVRASISAGTITQKSANVWTARPPVNAETVTITLTAAMTGGSPLSMSREFKVRQLPPATPFLVYRDASGNTRRFRGGTLSKKSLIEADGVKAAVDDGLLDIPFTVTGFEVTFMDSMGNALPEISQNGAFTQRQKEMIRNLARGKRFYITRVKATDPGGRAQNLTTTIEVIVN